MRFIHLSDLHLGKMLHGVSLLENGDQPDWVEKFLTLAEKKTTRRRGNRRRRL